jgi:hypothetical protein
MFAQRVRDRDAILIEICVNTPVKPYKTNILFRQTRVQSIQHFHLLSNHGCHSENHRYLIFFNNYIVDIV